MERAFWLRIEAICAGLPARGSGAVEGRPSAGCRRLPGYLVASVFGVALGLAAYGLYQLLSLHRRTATVQVAVVATLVGSVVFVVDGRDPAVDSVGAAFWMWPGICTSRSGCGYSGFLPSPIPG